MHFTNLTSKEFMKFAENHEQGNFQQTIGWGKLKETNGWNYYLLGIKNKNEVIAATLLLEKKEPLNLNIFYAPRGFLLDYKDKDILKKFTLGIKKFVRKKHGVFVKIDPFVLCYRRDKSGKILNEENNNLTIIENLKLLGYKHHGFTKNMEDLQPRWTFSLHLENKTKEEIFNNFDTNTKSRILKSEKYGVTTREISLDEIEKFKDVMKHTSKRKNFIDRPLSYYKNLKYFLGDKAKFMLSEINLNKCLNNLKTELNEQEEKLKIINNEILKKEKIQKSKKTKNKIKTLQESIANIKSEITEIKNLKAKNGENIILGSNLFMIQKQGIISLYGGSYQEYMSKFHSAYKMNWDMIKYALKNNLKEYNFYGISGNFEKINNNLYGLYDFKKGFDGNVEEYIGEFDLIVSNLKYKIYLILLKIYKKTKNIIKSIINK